MNLQQPIGEQIQRLEIPAKLGESVEAAQAAVADTYGNFSNAVAGAKETVGNTLNEFSTQNVGEASQAFLDSNSIIAKFVFLILVVVGFMFLLNLGVLLLGYFTTPSNSPFIISGMINANNGATIPQDPRNADSIQIFRSNNESTGLEFTWSVWLKVNDIDNNTKNSTKQYQHIFNKGDSNWDSVTGISKVNNAPGLYLDTKTNALHIVMNSVNVNLPSETVDVANIPLRKWFNCTIRMENKVLDVYINGTVAARLNMQNVPKQNYNDVNVCQNGGFSGSLADLRYYNHALSVMDINSLVVTGPNTNASGIGTASDSLGYSYYLSNMWYASKL